MHEVECPVTFQGNLLASCLIPNPWHRNRQLLASQTDRARIRVPTLHRIRIAPIVTAGQSGDFGLKLFFNRYEPKRDHLLDQFYSAIHFVSVLNHFHCCFNTRCVLLFPCLFSILFMWPPGLMCRSCRSYRLQNLHYRFGGHFAISTNDRTFLGRVIAGILLRGVGPFCFIETLSK